MKLNSKLGLTILLVLVLTSGLSALRLHPFLRSLILPGWGELSNDNASGYVFLASELISWSSYYYCLEEAELNEKAAYNYAVRYAGIPVNSNYPEDYFFQLKRYDNSNIEECDYLLEKAQEKFPNDLNAQLAFIDEYSWDWEIDDRRYKYGDYRTNITNYEDYARTITAAFILNRLISGINALRINSKTKNINAKMNINRYLNPQLEIIYRF